MTLTLTIDMLAHTWFAYVADSVDKSHHAAHWIIAVFSVTTVILPGLLRNCLTLNDTLPASFQNFTGGGAFCKLLAWPYFLGRTTTGRHSLIELVDVVLFICLMRSITSSDGGTKKYTHLSWTWLPDIRFILFILLTLQMVVWILPITYLASMTAAKKDEKYFEKTVLRFSMLVEMLTDVPE